MRADGDHAGAGAVHHHRLLRADSVRHRRAPFFCFSSCAISYRKWRKKILISLRSTTRANVTAKAFGRRNQAGRTGGAPGSNNTNNKEVFDSCFFSAEARRDAKGLSDLIDYFALAADGVVEDVDRRVLLAAWEFAGQDMDALPLEECFAIADRLARVFSLGRGWSLQCDLIREEYTEYITEPG